jgi:hypothetical protein
LRVWASIVILMSQYGCTALELPIFTDDEIGTATYVSGQGDRKCTFDVAALKEKLSIATQKIGANQLSPIRTLLSHDHTLVKQYRTYAGIRLVLGNEWWFFALEEDASWIITGTGESIGAYEYPAELRPVCE